MINPSDRWKFVQAIETMGWYEDDLVEHTLTEHRAIRRAFSEKLCADAVALEEVRAQIQLAAQVNPPALPRIYHMEETAGRLTVLMEQVGGGSLVDLVRQEAYAKARDWAGFAIQFVDEIIEMRRAGARLDRLDISHVVLTESGDVRIAQRWFVGTPPPSRIDQSPMLQRLALQPAMGVYASAGPPDDIAEFDAVKEILVKMACGNPKSTFETQREQSRQSPHLYPSSLGTIEQSVAQIILGIHRGTEGTGRFRTFEQLRDGIKELHLEETRKYLAELAARDHPASAATVHDSNPARPAYTPPAIASAPSGLMASPATGAALRSSGEVPRPAIAPAPAADPQSNRPGPRAIPTAFLPPNQRAAAAHQAPPPPAPAREPGNATTAPPSSARPASHPPALATAKRDSGTGSQLVEALEARKRKKSASTVGAIVGIAAFLGIAAFGTYYVLTKEPPNTRPTCILAPVTSNTVVVNEKLRLDATASSDAEGKPLTFYWSLKGPEGAQVIFTETKAGAVPRENQFASSSPTIDVQFLTVGEAEVELKVNDGHFFSDPTVVKVSVQPLKRGG